MDWASEMYNQIKKNHISTQFNLSKRQEICWYTSFCIAQLQELKNDWVSTVQKAMSELDMTIEFSAIEAMTENSYTKLWKEKVTIKVLKILPEKQTESRQIFAV